MKRKVKAVPAVSVFLAAALLCGCSDREYANGTADEQGASYGSFEGFGIFKSSGVSPFDGLVVEFDGVSPYCTISFNNSQCTEEIQQSVQYSLEADYVTTERYFKAGESVTVYAILNNFYGETDIELSETQRQYTVREVAEYITELSSDMDLAPLITEAEDYIEASTSFTSGQAVDNWMETKDFYFGVYLFEEATAPVKERAYFSSLKANAYSKYPEDTDCVNRIDMLCSISIKTNKNETPKNAYFAVTAKNIVRYPDGTLGWGVTDPAALDFEINIDTTSMASLENTNITSKKADYNVTEVTDILL